MSTTPVAGELSSPGIVDTPAARDAAGAALARLADEPDVLHGLGGITDEELVAYVGDPQQCHPFGSWYPTLQDEAKQVAQLAALRTLTTREQFALVGAGDEASYSMPQQTLALLQLRQGEPTLTAQRQTSDGTSWYLLRPLGEQGCLREVTTPQGYRSYALSTLCDGLREELLTWMHVGPDALPAEVDVTETTGQIEGEGDLGFLDRCDAVTTLIRVGPRYEDGGDVRLVHAKQGTVFVGEPVDQGTMRYRGEQRVALGRLWDEWAGLA